METPEIHQGSKPTIYIGAPLAAVLRDRMHGRRNLSQALATIGARYSEMVSRDLPTITAEQWEILSVVCRTWKPTPEGIAHLGSELDQAVSRNQFADVDADSLKSLRRSAHRWPFCTLVAAVDVCERINNSNEFETVSAGLRALEVGFAE